MLAEGVKTMATVPRIAASAAASSQGIAEALDGIAANGVPAILTLPLDSPLLPPWSPDVLIERVHTLHTVYSSRTSPRFGPYFDPNRPMARTKILNLVPEHDYVERDVDTRAFFASAADNGTTVCTDNSEDNDEPPSQEYLYYSGEIERDLQGSTGMLEEIRPLEAALIARNPQLASVNLWLSPAAPVSAQTMAPLRRRRRWAICFEATATNGLLTGSWKELRHADRRVVPDSGDARGLPRVQPAAA